MSSDSRRLAVNYDRSIHVLQIPSGSVINQFPRTQQVKAATFDERGDRLFVATHDACLLTYPVRQDPEAQRAR
jgi:hypothetical protein